MGMTDADRQKVKIMWLVISVSVLLMGVKFAAYFMTHSMAILTDAMESIINIIATSFALFSIYFAARPRDEDHPYGHGKIEFVSSGFEGGMVLVAGLAMIIKGIFAFFDEPVIHSVDVGVGLSLVAGLTNFILGRLLIVKGKKLNSSLMVADGKHLLSDTWSSLGLIIGLLVIWYTGHYWVDYVVTILFGGLILVTGYHLVRESLTGLLDEADYEKLDHLIGILKEQRRPEWIDIHKLRVQKYGAHLHVDCHITLPWYQTLEESHAEVTAVEEMVSRKLEGEVEFFIHSDPCLPTSCAICTVSQCKVRKSEFVKKLDWNLDNLLPNKKHSL